MLGVGSSWTADDGGGVRRLRPEEDPSWSLYPSTVLELGEGGALRVDLRRELPPDLPARLATLGLSGPFAVLTAANPFGRELATARNRGREARLRARLARLGVPHVRADGVSPDGRHRERGVAAPVSRLAAGTLARRYGQSAFFWYDGEAFWLVGAVVAVPPTRLPAT